MSRASRFTLFRCLIALGALSAPTFADAQSPPPSWLRYAELVSRRFQASLAESDPIADRFHAFLERQAIAAHDRPPISTIPVKVWFSASGEVNRVEFESLGNAQADRDLRPLLTRHPIGEAPPSDMRQPLILDLALWVKLPKQTTVRTGSGEPHRSAAAGTG